MANLNTVIVPAKVLKGGRHKVRIAVAHNGETRYIVTSIIIDSVKEFKNGAVVRRPDAAILNTKLRGEIQKYQNVIDELGYTEGLTCPELVYQIKNFEVSRHRTLSSIYKEFSENKIQKPGTRGVYSTSWATITRHLNPDILIEHINHATIAGLDKFLHEEGYKPTTIRNHFVFLKQLLNYAKRYGYVQYRIDPFVGHKLPFVQPRQSWITVDDVRTLRDLQSNKKNIRKCRDLIMLSYYLGGINMVDLEKINFNGTDTIKYKRTKTADRPKINEYVEFQIPEEAKEIINRIKGADGRIQLTSPQRDDVCRQFFRTNMPKLAELTGIPQLVYYSARKSFAQHAFQLGIHPSIVDYILGHKIDKGGDTLFNYIFVTPEMATEAVRKVLDNLK